MLVCSFSIGESLPDGRDGRLGTPAAAGRTEPDWRSRTRPEMRSTDFNNGRSQQVPDFLEPCLNLFPRRIRAITEQFALPLVFDSDDLAQFRQRKQGVAFGEGHPLGLEIASPKIFAADRVVILLYGGLFTGLHHNDSFPPRRHLKHVV